MGTKNRYDGVDAAAVQLIRRKVRSLIGKAGFRSWDFDDLMQELVIEVLQRLPKFNPNRGKKSSFIGAVINNKVRKMIAVQKTGKRDYRHCTCSLNDILDDGDSGGIERLETVDQERCLHLLGYPKRQAAQICDLSIDLSKVVEDLPEDLAELCYRLEIQSIADISRITGTPRGTIYELIKKIRSRLKAAGLNNYFSQCSDVFSREPVVS
ncbi:MAG: sigma-70 family RNA polymerase sigma factor [Myxococcota bacterium]|nr:sigma-70 family RNA polymerase sigma factor [Myxococcota bacterium]